MSFICYEKIITAITFIKTHFVVTGLGNHLLELCIHWWLARWWPVKRCILIDRLVSNKDMFGCIYFDLEMSSFGRSSTCVLQFLSYGCDLPLEVFESTLSVKCDSEKGKYFVIWFWCSSQTEGHWYMYFISISKQQI